MSAEERTDLASDRTNLAEDRTVLAHERSFAGWVRTAWLGCPFPLLCAAVTLILPNWMEPRLTHPLFQFLLVARLRGTPSVGHLRLLSVQGFGRFTNFDRQKSFKEVN